MGIFVYCRIPFGFGISLDGGIAFHILVSLDGGIFVHRLVPFHVGVSFHGLIAFDGGTASHGLIAFHIQVLPNGLIPIGHGIPLGMGIFVHGHATFGVQVLVRGPVGIEDSSGSSCQCFFGFTHISESANPYLVSSVPFIICTCPVTIYTRTEFI